MTNKKSTPKARLFIGSSAENLEIANAIHAVLQHDAECSVWNQGTFQASEFSLESLERDLRTYDFGIFVFAPDDLISSRGEEAMAVRDNVIFEAGMFIGLLGRERIFIFEPQSGSRPKGLSDLTGLNILRYEYGRSDHNWKSAVSPQCSEVTGKIKNLGKRSGKGKEPRPQHSTPAKVDVRPAPQKHRVEKSMSAVREAAKLRKSVTYSEEGDVKNKIRDYLNHLDEYREITLDFREVDAELRLAPGSAKRYFAMVWPSPRKVDTRARRVW